MYSVIEVKIRGCQWKPGGFAASAPDHHQTHRRKFSGNFGCFPARQHTYAHPINMILSYNCAEQARSFPLTVVLI